MAKCSDNTTAETSEYVRNLALGIQAELKRQGMSLAELAAASGVPIASLIDLLERTHAPDLINIERICLSLRVDPGHVFVQGRALWFERLRRPVTYTPPSFIMPFPGE